MELLLQKTEYNGKGHEQNGNRAGSAVCGSSLGKLCYTVCHGVYIKGTVYHVHKGGNHQQAKQPAEQQEKLSAQLSDILLDQHTHGLTVILHTGIECTEVCHGAEEDAAQQNPEQHRQPAEGSGLDGTGHGTCTGNG